MRNHYGSRYDADQDDYREKLEHLILKSLLAKGLRDQLWILWCLSALGILKYILGLD